MARYGSGVTRTGINTADTAYFNLMGGTGDRLLIRQIMVAIAVAPTAAPQWYLVRTTARGTQASTLIGQALDIVDPASIGTLDVCGTGASQPTFTNTNWVQNGALAVTAGGVFIWTFYDLPLIVPATAANGLAVANDVASGASTGTYTCSFLWDE